MKPASPSESGFAMEDHLPGPNRDGSLSPSHEKRRQTVLLRGLLIISLGGIVLSSASANHGMTALPILLLLAATNVALLFIPIRMVATLRFELLVGGLDILLLSAGVTLGRAEPVPLALSSLLLALIIAIGNSRAHSVAGGAAIGALHVWLAIGSGGFGPLTQLATDMLFLYSIGLYYDSLVEGIRRTRRTRDAENLERRELLSLLRILETIASSLDLRQVARAIVTEISAVVPSMRCSVLVVDEADSTCRVVASHDDPGIFMLELDLAKYPEIRQVLEHREPTIVSDVDHDPIMSEVRNLMKDVDCRSIMVMPVTLGDDVLGTLLIKTVRPGQTFSRRETDFCLAVARASASALKNALLHRASMDKAERHGRTARKLESILRNSPDMILTIDKAGVITEFNHGGEQLLGYDRSALIGGHIRSLTAPGEGDSFMGALQAGDTLAHHPCRMRSKSGNDVSMEFSMSTLRNDEGADEGTVCVGRDVTELKAAQLQLMQAEKLSTIGTVISEVAHELNNPLTTVLGFAQLLSIRSPDPSMSTDLEKISDAARRCQKIVKNLLSFSRVHKPERKYLGVNGIIEKTLDLKRYPLSVANIRIVQDIDERLPRTMLDFHQMEQVFLNLFNNAEHAMTAPGSGGGELRISTSLSGGRIRIAIQDTGHGMSQDTLRRIFDPFFTTKDEAKGTGLGLSVSYGIIKEHGGTIEVQSQIGRGATFVITLPITGEPASLEAGAEGDEAALQSNGPGKGQRVLVVDDEPTILDLLIVLLEQSGFQVDTASNGEEACRKALKGDYDLILSDIKMPRVDGIEFYRRLRAQRPEMIRNLVFMSGDLLGKETAEFLEREKVPNLPKPLEIPVLMKAIEDALGARTA